MERSVQESLFQPLPTAEELRRALKDSENGDLRELLGRLFDKDTFVELGVYTKRSFCEYATSGRTNELEGVICGYGAVSGVLVYAFAQDMSRMKGAVDETHAKKICALYEHALKNGAPVIGVFSSAGADVYEGVSALAAYGSILRTVSRASGKIPQLALVNGCCIGLSAAVAALFDFAVVVDGSSFYVRSGDFSDEKNTASENNEALCAVHASTPEHGADVLRNMLYYIPSRADDGVEPAESPDNLNRMLGDLDFGNDSHAMLSAISDNGVYLELYRNYAYEMVTAFSEIGGVRCGILSISSASGGHLSASAAQKATHMISFCNAFSIPLITLVDSQGLAENDTLSTPYAKSLARLAAAYATSDMPKVTVVLGHAIGSAFTLLGSKALGADVAYALDTAEIGALPSNTSVAFAWNDRVSSMTTREELETEWRRSIASPVAAASRGEIDDIITIDELRIRLCSSLLMLCAGGTSHRRSEQRTL